MIVNISTLTDLFRGYQTAFEGALEAGPPILWQEIAMLVNSSGYGENYAWLGEDPKLRKWIGPRQVQRLAAHRYTIDNEPYEATIGVNRDDIEDDRLGVYTTRAVQMGLSARMWPDEVVFALLELGISSVCYDGQFFFDIDHPVGNEADGYVSTSNMYTGDSSNAATPWYLFDTTKIVKPLIWQLRKPPQFVAKTDIASDHVFFEKEYYFGTDARGAAGFGLWQCALRNIDAIDDDGFENACSQMNAFTDDHGRSLGINPNILMCGLSNQFAARELVNRQFKSDLVTPNNAQGLTVVVNPLLA